MGRAFQPPLKASQAAPALPPPQLPQLPSIQNTASILDCIFRRGKQAAQDGTLLLRGRTATLHSLDLAEVASARLDAATAEALHGAYAAAITAAVRGGSSLAAVAPAVLWLQEESPEVVLGPVRMEIEDSPAAAVSAQEWAVRQDVQRQVALQARKRSAPYELQSPELEPDNRGAKLLAKMGWVHGEGLGAANQGIATPLMPTVRRSKTGLGASHNVKQLGTHTTHFRPAAFPGAAAGKENAGH